MRRKYSLLASGLMLLVILAFIVPSNLSAQNLKEINGVVKTNTGFSSGVSVMVKADPKIGVITDVDGKYNIKVPENSTLVFRSVGYKPVEMPVNGRTVIDVYMVVEDVTLDEVVIGYGTQKKINVIGSVVTINNKELTASPVSNISNAIAGRLPGAVIQQSNGEPGNDGASILIRGMATLGNNQPLVVIDGIPGRDLNSI